MKGEIKTYRGYNEEYGWVYGFLVINEDGWFIVNTDVIWLQENGFPGLEKRFQVNPMSVSQKIGLDDEKDKTLFEFDIVEVTEPSTILHQNPETVKAVIEYDEESASYRAVVYENIKDFEKDDAYDVIPLHGDIFLRKIGNAFENRNLIENSFKGTK